MRICIVNWQAMSRQPRLRWRAVMFNLVRHLQKNRSPVKFVSGEQEFGG